MTGIEEAMVRRSDRSQQRAFAGSMLVIAGLLAAYWVLTDIHAIPRLISSAFAALG